MRFLLDRVGPPTRQTWIIYFPVFLWLSALLGAAVFSRLVGKELSICIFRNVTGYPCPSCGSTRGMIAILQGHIWQGLCLNPVFIPAFLLVLAWLGMRFLLGMQARLLMTRREKWLLIAAGSLLTVAQWLYNLRYLK